MSFRIVSASRWPDGAAPLPQAVATASPSAGSARTRPIVRLYCATPWRPSPISVADWRFCPRCATPLRRERRSDGVVRPACPACRFVVYEQPKVGAGALVVDDGRLVLARRAHEPWAGRWNLPAGYLERDERPEEAAVREAREETGLSLRVRELFGLFTYTDDPRGPGVFVVYRCDRTAGELRPGAEVREVTSFARDELPAELAGGGHDQAIRAWARGG